MECLRMKSRKIATYRSKIWKQRNKAHVKAEEAKRYHSKIKAQRKASKEQQIQQEYEEKLKKELESGAPLLADKAREKNEMKKKSLERYLMKISLSMEETNKIKQHDPRFRELFNDVKEVYNEIETEIDIAIEDAQKAVCIEEIYKIFEELNFGEPERFAYQTWSRVEGSIIIRLMKIGESLNEDVECNDCMFLTDRFCGTFQKFKRSSETKCDRGSLVWAKDFDIVKEFKKDRCADQS